MSHQYYKAPPADPLVAYKKKRLIDNLSRFKNLLPTIFITVGASLLISVGYPIISYELTTAQHSIRRSIISPIPDESLAGAKGLNNPNNPPQVLAESDVNSSGVVDYTRISSWFNFAKPQPYLSPSSITDYTLTIPKLRIKNALVTIGGDDLDKSLIHYGGTANPGEPGSPVIFGHSVLPQFYNPNSYRSVFSLIPSLKPGDEILINFDGISYKYVVYDYYEVSPDEIDILEQRYNQKDLTLVTCTPPGTYWRRGIIKAKLVS